MTAKTFKAFSRKGEIWGSVSHVIENVSSASERSGDWTLCTKRRDQLVTEAAAIKRELHTNTNARIVDRSGPARDWKRRGKEGAAGREVRNNDADVVEAKLAHAAPGGGCAPAEDWFASTSAMTRSSEICHAGIR